MTRTWQMFTTGARWAKLSNSRTRMTKHSRANSPMLPQKLLITLIRRPTHLSKTELIGAEWRSRLTKLTRAERSITRTIRMESSMNMLDRLAKMFSSSRTTMLNNAHGTRRQPPSGSTVLLSNQCLHGPSQWTPEITTTTCLTSRTTSPSLSWSRAPANSKERLRASILTIHGTQSLWLNLTPRSLL